MKKYNSAYVVGISDHEILCYNELEDYKAADCYFFSSDPGLFCRFTRTEANAICKGRFIKKIRPDLAGKLNVYYWEYTVKVELVAQNEEIFHERQTVTSGVSGSE
jgi:hypothetical protein